DQQDVRLLQLDIPRGGARLDALVVVVDRHRQHLLRALLVDDVLVEDRLDLGRLGKTADLAAALLLPLLGDDVVAQLHALVADVHGRAGDELPDVVLALAAERALQDTAVRLPRSRHALSPGPGRLTPGARRPPPERPGAPGRARRSRRPRSRTPSPAPRS